MTTMSAVPSAAVGDTEAAAAQLIADIGTALAEVSALACNGYPADDAELLVAEGVRHSLRLASAALLTMVECEPTHPYLVKIESITRQFGLPAVDCVYHYTPLHGDHCYRLRGPRGSACIFEIEVWQGRMSQLGSWRFFAAPACRYEADEVLDIRFARDAAGPNAIQLPEGDCCVMIRQYYADWDHERPAQLYIEREGATYPPPSVKLPELAARLAEMQAWMRGTAAAERHWIRQYLDTDPARMVVFRLPFGFTGLHYVRGHYRCTPDQAVILEVKPPRALLELPTRQRPVGVAELSPAPLRHQSTSDDARRQRSVSCCHQSQ